MDLLPGPVPFSCGYDASYSMLDFQPIFNTGTGGVVSNYTGNDTPVCNVDPSQANFDFAVAVTGQFCDLPEDYVYFAAEYTGAVDGLVTTVTASTTLPATVTASFIVVYTGLPYSAVSDGGEVRLTAYDNVYSANVYYCEGDGGNIQIPTSTETLTNFYTNVFSMIQVRRT